ncbi:Phosphatidylserine decarboxylase-related [Dillenia turbinata]|uniref:Phosphatidylserine decarboxylase-related n=1 Tax=Dillenia turbinata TaxID=194707 RepID=A0AAN8YXQ5_9MAGN
MSLIVITSSNRNLSIHLWKHHWLINLGVGRSDDNQSHSSCENQDVPRRSSIALVISFLSRTIHVFNENKRVVSMISTIDFGKVAFVAGAATMLTNISFSKKEGKYAQKGDEEYQDSQQVLNYLDFHRWHDLQESSDLTHHQEQVDPMSVSEMDLGDTTIGISWSERGTGAGMGAEEGVG